MVTEEDKFCCAAHCPRVSLGPWEQKNKKELETTPNIIQIISVS